MPLNHRHQSPEKRPSFPDVVDELLSIEKDLPDTRFTEVNCSSLSVNFLYVGCVCGDL